jgi:hypothetical protein
MTDVPEGTVQEVLDWVGDDPTRAASALDAERNGQQRSTLMTKLEAIASGGGTDVTETEAPDNTLPEVDGPNVDPDDFSYDEQHVDVVIDLRDEGVVIGPLSARDNNVEVTDDDDLRKVLAASEEDEVLVDSEQVEFFQFVGGPHGLVISLNGTMFALTPQVLAAFKRGVDSAVVGTTL